MTARSANLILYSALFALFPLFFMHQYYAFPQQKARGHQRDKHVSIRGVVVVIFLGDASLVSRHRPRDSPRALCHHRTKKPVGESGSRQVATLSAHAAHPRKHPRYD